MLGGLDWGKRMYTCNRRRAIKLIPECSLPASLAVVTGALTSTTVSTAALESTGIISFCNMLPRFAEGTRVSDGHQGVDVVDSPVVVESFYPWFSERVQGAAVRLVGVKPQIVQQEVAIAGDISGTQIVLEVLSGTK